MHTNFYKDICFEDGDKKLAAWLYRVAYMARALIRRATPFFSVTVTQQQITKAAESNLVTINRVLTCF